MKFWFKVKSLSEIAERTIKAPANKKVLLHEKGETRDIIRVILKTAPVSLEDTRDFVRYIRSDNVYNTCRRIWDFLKSNIKYKIDPSGDQYIQTPAYTWYRKRGDCKSYSIFISSMLKNLGITHRFRFVSFKTADKTITHVYIVVPDKGKTIIMDVVMPGFDREQPYIFKTDYTMAKIYQLSGIGQKPKNQGKILFNLENKPVDKLTEGELDLLIARDRLITEKRLVENMTGIGSLKAEKYQDSLDVINDVIEAVEEYQSGKIPDIEAEIGMIIEDAENGDYALAREIVGIGDIFGRKAKRKEKRKARKVKRRAAKKEIKKTLKGKEKRKALRTVRKELGTKTGKFLRKVGKTVKKGYKTMWKVATLPQRLAVKGILELYLPKAAPHFLYLFIKDEDVSRMPQAVQKKRKKQAKIADFIVKAIGMKRRHFMGIVRNGIMKRYGKSPEAVIKDQMAGKFSGIWGVIGDIFGRGKRAGKRPGLRGRTLISTVGTEQITAYRSLRLIRDNIDKTMMGESIKISLKNAPVPSDWDGLTVRPVADKTAVKKIIDTIPKTGPYFLYLFVKDIGIVKKLPVQVREKRKHQELIAEYLIRALGISRNQFMALLRKGIKADLKKEPEAILADQMKGKISGVGVIPVAAAGGAMKALLWIINKIMKVFKKKKVDVSELDAAAPADWGDITAAEKEDLPAYVPELEPEQKDMEAYAPYQDDFRDLTAVEKEELTTDLKEQFDMEEEFKDGGRSIWDTLRF